MAWTGDKGHGCTRFKRGIDLGDVTTEGLDGIVKEVNDSAVEPCDRLSDHAYYYDREMDEIRIRK